MTVTEQAVDWLTWRRAGIGGSDIGALLGLSTYASPWSLWAEKTGRVPIDPTSNQRQRIGQRMETVLAAEFAVETGLVIAGGQTWCTSKEWPTARCTVDGFVVEHPDGEPLGIWEAKTDAHFAWPDGPPASYLAQCRWNMAVTGTTSCWLTVMFAGFRIETFLVEQDDNDVAFMLARAREFWSHVESGEPPAVDASDATTAAIGAVWPNHEPGVTTELDEIADLVRERAGRKIQARELDRLIKEMDNEIKVLLGDAEVGTVNGAPVVTWRQQDGRSHECSACHHIDRAAPFRVLRSKKERA